MGKQSFESAKVYNLKDSISIAEGGVVSKQFIKNKGGNISFPFLPLIKDKDSANTQLLLKQSCKLLKEKQKSQLMEKSMMCMKVKS